MEAGKGPTAVLRKSLFGLFRQRTPPSQILPGQSKRVIPIFVVLLELATSVVSPSPSARR